MKRIQDIAHKAGLIIKERFLGQYSIKQKKDESPVTEADREADKFIRKKMNEMFPNDTIISEEQITEPVLEKGIRYIDPLDGTKDFIEGSEKFSIIIGHCNKNNIPDYGIIHFPMTNEYLYTEEGKVIYEKGGVKKIIKNKTNKEIFYKESAIKYKNTNKIIKACKNKIKIRPSGFGMKEFIINKGREFILGHGYKYELCAFDAIIRNLSGSIKYGINRDNINYFNKELRIEEGCFIGFQKNE